MAQGQLRPPMRRWLSGLLVSAALVAAMGELAARSRRQAREATRLTEEQVALRRVATLVAQSVPASEVFEAVTREVGLLSGADLARMERYEADGTVTGVAGWSRVRDRLAVGTRFALDGESIAGKVQQTSRPVRLDTFARAAGPIAREARELGIRSSVGAPIVVAGRLWGVIAASSKAEAPFPPNTESQIADFTELVATAIANAESRGEGGRLAKEQAALRRVATLVARGAPPHEVFAAVTDEVCRLLDLDVTVLLRFEPGLMATYLGGDGWKGAGMRLGDTVKLEPSGTLSTVLQTGSSARIDDLSGPPGSLADNIRGEGIQARVSIPITVEGRVWGALGIGSRSGPMPADTEQRLVDFTELVGTAIANAESRAEVRLLLEQQAALRRVATLVARGVPPGEIFTAVADEVGRVLGSDATIIVRLDPDGVTTILGRVGDHPDHMFVGSRWELDPQLALAEVLRTGRPARRDDYGQAPGAFAEVIRGMGIRSSVAIPIVVEGRIWGALGVGTRSERFAADTERRIANFTELVAVAIGNAVSRAEVAASRARVVAASDQTRRRIERDLHDGAQQRLVSLGLELRLAQGSVPPDLPEVRAGIDHVVDGLTDVFDELREMSRGIHPAILSEGGLGPALRTLARRSAVPVELDVRTERRFPEPVEVAAYYVVSEALTNTTKHSRASHANVAVEERDGNLRLSMRDDGVGGVDPVRGSGLIGLRDRVEALGGSIDVSSPSGDGTLVLVTLPVHPG
jgi:Signal transduction histidine kinase